MKYVVYSVAFIPQRGFSFLSNFIEKVENRKNLTFDDVRNVRYKGYNQKYTDNQWAHTIYESIEDYQQINRPENIPEVYDKVERIYAFFINEKDILDIAEFQNLYLIKEYYKDKKIFVFIRGEREFYHRVSHFMFSINVKKSYFYDQIYFAEVSNDKIKRLQLQGKTASRSFLPLQYVDKEVIADLAIKVGDTEVLDLLCDLKEEKQSNIWDEKSLLSGAVKNILENKDLFISTENDEIRNLFANMSVLAFLMFSYMLRDMSHHGGVSGFDINNARGLCVQLEQYANACRQLLENIIHHSPTGIGCYLIRIHRNKSEYLEKMYNIGIMEADCYLEVAISDYASEMCAKTIAQSFLMQAETDEQRELLETLESRDFFQKFSQYNTKNEVWRKYYDCPDNIGRHLGIAIFETITLENGGCFRAESHSTHTIQQGDCYTSYGQKIEGVCLPGTRYYMNFPTKVLQTQLLQQDISMVNRNEEQIISFDYNYNKDHTKIADLVLNIKKYGYSDQNEKNHIIGVIENTLYKQVEKMKGQIDVFYINLESYDSRFAEIFVKAIILLLQKAMYVDDLILYQCDNDLKIQMENVLFTLYKNGNLENVFRVAGVSPQIAIFSKRFEESFFILSDFPQTCGLSNYISRLKCIVPNRIFRESGVPLKKSELDMMRLKPYDIMHEVTINQEKMTLFEHYTKSILEADIQGEQYGCKIKETHMRLGSTIHINTFYEAELLFSNRMFTMRFAVLICKKILPKLKDNEKLTLYGYATYSEMLLGAILEIIGREKPDVDIDYIILEREEENRGLLHSDRIRYGRPFENKELRKKYYSDRKFIIIVPINSTLKTHDRLVRLLLEENELSADKHWLLDNYALILVGDEDRTRNKYWTLDKNNKKIKTDTISPYPHYNIEVQADYHEALKCNMCYPDILIDEKPLIEVNAASTIPNQSFRVKLDKNNLRKIDYEWIKEEEQKLECTKNNVCYGHIQRNENHYMYYFETERIFEREKDQVRKKLSDWKKKNDYIPEAYNILVSPMHFSNAGFLELIDEEIFQNTALIVRVDFDKEYRSNAYAKYSNIRNYIKQLSARDETVTVGVHFTDDSIITGRTFNRAKSIIKSIIGLEQFQDKNVKFKIFSKIFVLIDRNSLHTKLQYVEKSEEGLNVNDVERDFFSFLDVNISSLRNYGNSCVVCNLMKQSGTLEKTASSRIMADYWKKQKDKFTIHPLKEESSTQSFWNGTQEQRGYRRLVCGHIAKQIVADCNETEEALQRILELLVCDYSNREEYKFDYFISYIKVLSRPFLSFDKVTKEAIFDILLVMIQKIVTKKGMEDILNETETKDYLKTQKVVSKFQELDNILNAFSDKEKQDLLWVLMKQLVEMKSNYIIRLDSIHSIWKCMQVMWESERERESERVLKTETQFMEFYAAQVKKLVGISSDTSKSLWLDYALQVGREYQNQNNKVASNDGLKEFEEWVFLENTRVYRDGIEKLYIILAKSNIGWEVVPDFLENLYQSRMRQRILQEMKNYRDTIDEKSDEDIVRFLKDIVHDGLPCPKERISCLVKNKEDAQKTIGDVFDYVYDAIEEDYEMIERKKFKLIEKIKKELNVYQFDNFQKLLKIKRSNIDLEFDMEIDQLDIEDIICAVQIRKFCEESKKGERVENGETETVREMGRLARLISCMVHGGRVYMAMENDDKIEYWRLTIQNAYNKKVESYIGSVDDKFTLKIPKHYMLLASDVEQMEEIEEIPPKVLPAFDKFYEDEVQRERGYCCGEDYLLMEVGDDFAHKVLLYVELDAKEDRYVTLGRMRKVMAFYFYFSKYIFSIEHSKYLYELVVAKKDLELYNRKKAHSHTKDDAIETQYQYLLNREENIVDEGTEYYKSFVLNLLADLNVSTIYRESTKLDFYQRKFRLEELSEWSEIAKLLQPKMFLPGKYSEDIKQIQICIDSEVKGEVICDRKMLRELSLLLVSIILNAGGRNRGKIEDGVINVEIKKTVDACLAISNVSIDNRIEKNEINSEIKKKPVSEGKGISLWGMSRYLKNFIYCVISKKIQNMTLENMESVKRVIERLLSDEFEVRVEGGKKGEQSTFTVYIPIFWEKYRNLQQDMEVKYE